MALPSVIITALLGLYSGETQATDGAIRGAGLTPPWEENGLGKYAGTPLVVIGGSSSVGQQS